jgi:hypothetical protein
MEKIFNHKNFNYFVWTPLGSRVNLQKHFCLQVHLKGTVSLDFFASGFFHESVSPPAPEYPIRTVSNFFLQFAEIFASQDAPPASTTLTKLVAKFAAGVVDTGGAP